MTLYHEKLDVYQASIQLLTLCFSIGEAVPKGHGPLTDQLRRAAMSIPLNIAEGVGKAGDGDKARFHSIARGSAMECSAILDVLRVLRGSDPSIDQAKTLIVRIVEMLTKMCR